MLGTAITLPAAAGPGEAALGSDQDFVSRAVPAAERVGDQPLVVPEIGIVETVDVGGVDQAYAGVQRRADHLDAHLLGRSFLEGQVHAAVAHGGYGGGARPEGAELHDRLGADG